MNLRDGNAPPDLESTFEKRRLELIMLGNSIMMSENVMLDAKFNLTKEMAGRMVASIKGYLWSEELGHKCLEVPYDWWEHFKQRWFPSWATKRWPVLWEWHDAAVILPRVPVVRPEYNQVEFPVWRKE